VISPSFRHSYSTTKPFYLQYEYGYGYIFTAYQCSLRLIKDEEGNVVKYDDPAFGGNRLVIDDQGVLLGLDTDDSY
jgi:hypothetical protein